LNNISDQAPSSEHSDSRPGKGLATAATPLSRCPPSARNSHPEPAGRDASNRISAADWFSSAPLATFNFRLEALASCCQPAHRAPRVVGSHRLLTTCESTAASPFPASAARMAARLVPRRPAAVETSSVSVAQCPGPAPERLVRPPLGRMSRRQTPLSHFERRFRHPGALHRSQERPAPCLTNVRNETPQGALPPTSPVARPIGLRPQPHGRAATAPRLCHRGNSFRQTFTVLPSNR
jgi:hypothetical protein